jgi:hypothetical protein
MKNTYKKTQKEKVLEHLLAVGSITVAEAISLWYSWRLPATIGELSKDGVQITTINEPHPGGYHSRYVLKERKCAENLLEEIKNRRNKKIDKGLLSSSSYSVTSNSIKPQS